MAGDDRTSSSMEASEAARIMDDPNATAEEKSVAASVLAQDGTDDRTSERVAGEAGQLLDDQDISAEDRDVAASDLSQRSDER
ncbi:hypothetical protein G7070_11680 [Propioniciclava coleopterorum]|uniref:Uncharacterized protein n=2 Tax=Propioniciclava coleopterorum TaxID=2714937 RepID=A0A6G7YB79_9ACTN|nr:hypothetical protein G7070_11680 [Propioniciclava coleopterorum]